MKRSTDRILTTHTGSLPREPEIADLLSAREKGEAVPESELESASRRAVEHCVERQLPTGLDVINDGEQSKPSDATYVIDRLSGFEGERRKKFPKRLDSADFPEWARLAAPPVTATSKKAQVIVPDRSLERRPELSARFGNAITIVHASLDAIEHDVARADLYRLCHDSRGGGPEAGNAPDASRHARRRLDFGRRF